MKRAGVLAVTALAVVGVVGIVGTIAAESFAPVHPAPTPSVATSPSSPPASRTPATPTDGTTPAGPPPSTVPDPTPGAPPAPVVTGAGSTGGVVSIVQTYAYTDGVRVQVTKVKRAARKKRDLAVGVKRGAPIQTLSVRVTNGAPTPLSLTAVLATMNYGSKHKVAHVVQHGTPRPLVGTLLPGRARTGTFTFAVPQKQIDDATLRLSIDTRHAPAVFTGSLGYSPGNGAVFNDPTRSKARQNAIINHIERSIVGAAKGSTIRIAQYSFDVKASADKLLAAHRRGVHIQMIVDQHEGLVTPETRRLIRALGKNRHHKSFLVRCKASCMSSRTSAMHAKFYLFSRVGNSHRVSMISSANITHTNSGSSWNDIQTITDSPVLYDSLTKYFKDMAPDKNRPNYYRKTSTGPYELFFFPRGRKDGGRSAVLARVLDHVSCNGAAPGFGTKDGHTIVRVGMYSWTSDRIDIARKLWKLHNKGCKVEIVYNSGRTTSPITYTLLRHSKKHGQLSLYDAWRDRNLNNSPERYMHEKMLTINGVWSGRNTKVVYAGSQNFTPNATLDNNDLIFRNSTASVYDDYAKNFKSIRDETRRLHHFVRGFQHDPVEKTW